MLGLVDPPLAGDGLVLGQFVGAGPKYSLVDMKIFVRARRPAVDLERLNAQQISPGQRSIRRRDGAHVPDDDPLRTKCRTAAQVAGASLQAKEACSSRIRHQAAAAPASPCAACPVLRLHHSSISRFVAKDRKARPAPALGNRAEQNE